jgi:hypothetical protein
MITLLKIHVLTLAQIDLWNLYVGPVQVASINTTVSPTPIPSSELVPPPPLYYPPFPTGEQSVIATSNESLKYPSNFWWGVASAAYQVEGTYTFFIPYYKHICLQ